MATVIPSDSAAPKSNTVSGLANTIRSSKFAIFGTSVLGAAMANVLLDVIFKPRDSSYNSPSNVAIALLGLVGSIYLGVKAARNIDQATNQLEALAAKAPQPQPPLPPMGS